MFVTNKAVVYTQKESSYVKPNTLMGEAEHIVCIHVKKCFLSYSLEKKAAHWFPPSQSTVFSHLLPALHNDPLHEYNHASWRLLLMSCLCVPGSSMRRVIQRRSASSTRPWSTATPSSPLSPSSELWDASRLTLLMQPER